MTTTRLFSVMLLDTVARTYTDLFTGLADGL